MESLDANTSYQSFEKKEDTTRMPTTKKSRHSSVETKKPETKAKWGLSDIDKEIIKKAALLDQLRAQIDAQYSSPINIKEIKSEYSAYDEVRMTPGEKERMEDNRTKKKNHKKIVKKRRKK